MSSPAPISASASASAASAAPATKQKKYYGRWRKKATMQSHAHKYVPEPLSSSYYSTYSPKDRLDALKKFTERMDDCEQKSSILTKYHDFMKSSVPVSIVLAGKDFTEGLTTACKALISEYIFEKYKVTAKEYVSQWQKKVHSKCKQLGYGYHVSSDIHHWGVPVEDFTQDMMPTDDIFIAAYSLDITVEMGLKPQHAIWGN